MVGTGGDHLGGAGRYTTESVIYLSWALIVIVTGGCAALTVFERFRGVGRLRWVCLLLVLSLCLLMPVAYAFGSSNLITGAASTGIGPVFAAILVGLTVLTRATGSRWVTSLGLAGLSVVGASVVATAGNAPYRLNSDLGGQVIDTEIGSPPTRLRLDAASNGFFVEMSRIAAVCEFTPGEEVIDLTGRSPGIVFALGGLSPGAAWYPGGRPGSHDAATYFLSFVPDERKRQAWLLVSPGFRLVIEPESVLQQFGVAFPEDFELCGSASWPLLRNQIQLWRPVRPGRLPVADAKIAAALQRAEENGNADSYADVGVAYQETGLYHNAVVALEQALVLDPRLSVALDTLCTSHIELRAWDAAAEACTRALELSPGSTVAQGRLERVQQGRAAQATIDGLLNGVRQNPNAAGFVRLGIEYYRAGRMSDSIDASRQALEIQPDSRVALSNMCAAFSGLEEWEQAIEACNRALEIEPDFPLAQANLRWAQRNLAAR